MRDPKLQSDVGLIQAESLSDLQNAASDAHSKFPFQGP
jgi:hypothetical protein